jgi:hypothetical protein
MIHFASTGLAGLGVVGTLAISCVVLLVISVVERGPTVSTVAPGTLVTCIGLWFALPDRSGREAVIT